jgi:hypothetical protein
MRPWLVLDTLELDTHETSASLFVMKTFQGGRYTATSLAALRDVIAEACMVD